MNDRGQTQYDYLVGITLLLLTISGVFLQIPDIFDQAPEVTESVDQAVAERAADNLTDRAAIDGNDNYLNFTVLNQSLHENWSKTRDRAGLDIRQAMNVSVTNGTNSSAIVASNAGEWNYADGDNIAFAKRIVKFDNSSRCSTVCRLTVRVWVRDG